MPVFLSQNAFDLNHLNLHAIYGQTHSVVSRPGATYSFDFPAVQLGGTVIDIPTLTVSFPSAFGVSAASQTLIMAGQGLTADSHGALTGGSLGVFGQLTSGNVDFQVAGIDLPAAAFNAAAQSTSPADDIALFSTIFAGNDLITLSNQSDVFDAGGGNDLVIDTGGADRITGGDGNDAIFAGNANDKVDAGPGNDIVLGGSGKDKIEAGLGDDVIWAGAGNDTVAGGDGADTFLFKKGDGVDRVMGFVPGVDHIQLIVPASGLANLQMTQTGADVTVTFSDVTVILDGVQLGAVSPLDFDTFGNATLSSLGHVFFDGWTFL